MKIKNLLVFICFSAFCVQAQEAERKLSSKEIKLLIDSTGAILKRWYVYPDKAALIDKTLHANYKSGAYNKVQSPMELAGLLHADIQRVHHDGHMGFFYNPGFAEQLLTQLPDSLQKKEEQMGLNNERLHNFHFVKTEVLPGNIGYVRWDGFTGYTSEAQSTFESAFRFVVNTKALIIDMRHNGGGSPETVNALLNYFFETRLPMNHIIDHLDTMKHYTDPKATAFKLGMPVYILTSKRTFSGAEDFTYAMKYAKRAVVLGDTTGGGAHPTGPVAVGHGFVMHVPNARSYNEVTKGNWEGTGVWPDMAVPGEQAFEKAQFMIFSSLLSKASDDEERNELKWHLAVMENRLLLAEAIKTGAVNPGKEELRKFCGEFNPRPGPGSSPYIMSIVLKEEQLYRHISLPPDWRLLPISKTRFVYENDEWNRYLDVILNAEGQVSGITLYRADGIFQYDKIK